MALGAVGVLLSTVLACVGEEPNSVPPPDGSDATDGSTHVDAGQSDSSGGQDATTCGHDLCVDFDTSHWNDGWTETKTSDGGSSVIEVTGKNAPPSAPSSLRTSTNAPGRAHIKTLVPWGFGAATRSLEMQVDVYVEYNESRGPIVAFPIDDSGEAQIVTVSLETNGELTIVENDNGSPPSTLKTCNSMGSLPQNEWTRISVTLEGRSATAGGWLSVGVSGSSPRRCDLVSTRRPAKIGIYVGLLAFATGARVVQYDNFILDIKEP